MSSMLSRGIVVSMGLLAAALLQGCGDGGGAGGPLDQELRPVLRSRGITPLDPGPRPDANQVRLGEALFFDRELSGNRDIACATCHHPSLMSGDALSVSLGTRATGLGPDRRMGEGELIPRNAPEIFNRGAPDWFSMFWDSRILLTRGVGFVSPAGAALPDGLETVLGAQAMFPVTSRDEMRGHPGDVDVFGGPNELALINDGDLPAIWQALMERLLSIPGYVSLFQTAYPQVPVDDLGFQHAANAIGAFEADAFTLLDSPWDRYVAGDSSALSVEARQGALLFYGAAGCADCHAGNLLTDQRHYSLCAPQVGPGKGAEAPLDFGRGRETGAGDRFKFRTPPLRNVEVTGPWMHSGAYTTLEAAVRHHLDPINALRDYDQSQLDPLVQGTFQNDPAVLAEMLTTLDPRFLTPPALSDAQVGQLLAFLRSLTSPSVHRLPERVPDRVPSGLPVDRAEGAG